MGDVFGGVFGGVFSGVFGGVVVLHAQHAARGKQLPAVHRIHRGIRLRSIAKPAVVLQQHARQGQRGGCFGCSSAQVGSERCTLGGGCLWRGGPVWVYLHHDQHLGQWRWIVHAHYFAFMYISL